MKFEYNDDIENSVINYESKWSTVW